jgi:hypothetical protein
MGRAANQRIGSTTEMLRGVRWNDPVFAIG